MDLESVRLYTEKARQQNLQSHRGQDDPHLLQITDEK